MSPLRSALPLAALSLVALAAQESAAPMTGTDAERLDRALDTVTARELSADLHFVASDALAGRDSPSEELKVAARFLRARLARLGFEPGAPDGFLYEYTLPRTALDPERCRATVARDGATTELAYASDYWIGSRWSAEDLDVEGEVVFGGRGTREELEGVAPEGRWVVCLDDGGNARNRSNTARAAGAAGLLLVPAPDYAGEPYPARFADTVDSLAQGRLGSGGPSRRGPSFSWLYLGEGVAADLFAGAPDRPDGAGPDWTPPVGASLGATFTEHRRTLAGEEGEATLENVCGFWRGSDPELWRETILLSAHYDHVGTRGGEVYNGADDNGSGTVGLLAVAEALAEYGPLRRSVMLIWVSAEEKGLLGSEAWVADPWLPGGARPVANINIDMIGRNAPDQLLYTPTPDLPEFYNGLAQVVERLAPQEGFTDLGSADSYYHRSDQASFERLGIPVMFLFTDVHEDYHGPGDTPDKIDYDKLRRVVRVVVRMLTELQTDTLELRVETPAADEAPAEEPAPSGAGER